jgi:hypothetical protein
LRLGGGKIIRVSLISHKNETSAKVLQRRSASAVGKAKSLHSHGGHGPPLQPKMSLAGVSKCKSSRKIRKFSMTSSLISGNKSEPQFSELCRSRTD